MKNTEQSSVKDRLLIFLNHKNISQKEFEMKTGLSNGYVNNIRKSIKSETFDKKIQPIFPELNKFWLLHDDGKMLNEGLNIEAKNDDKPYTNDITIEVLKLQNEFQSVCITDSSGKVEYVNDDYVKQTGYSKQEVYGKKPKEYLQRDDFPEDVTKEITKNLQTKNHFYAEIYPNYIKNGNKVICKLHIYRIKNNYVSLMKFQ